MPPAVRSVINTAHPRPGRAFLLSRTRTEMRTGLASYISNLKEVPSAVYDLGGIIYFAISHPELELPGNQTDQGYLIEALQTRPNSTVDSDGSFDTFFTETGSGKYVPRSIFVDLDPSLTMHARLLSYRSRCSFPSRSFLSPC